MSRDYSPLSVDELEQLDLFLLSEVCQEDAVTVDTAHGLLTALIIQPHPIEAAEWLPLVWGEPNFVSAEQADQMRNLLLRMYHEIETTLRTRSNFEALAIETDEEEGVITSYDGWCAGFMLGTSIHEEIWQNLPQDIATLIVPMAAISLINDEEEETEIDEEEYAEWIELIPGAVMGLYSYFHPHSSQVNFNIH
jgi:uncharacterized protein